MKKNFVKVAAIAALALAVLAGSVHAQKAPSARQERKAIKNETKAIKLQREQEELKQQYELENLKHRKAVQNAGLDEAPCTVFDDAEWFTFFGERRVKQSGMNLAPTTLLRTLQQGLLQKLQAEYKAVVRDYADQMEFLENDEGNGYAVSHIESAGDRVIQRKINETYETCRKNTAPDAQGYITLYMAIKISKKEVIDEIAKEISEDKKLGVRWNEQKFRDSAFKVFEQEQKQDYQNFQNENTPQE